MPEIPFEEATLEDILLLIGGLINRGGHLEYRYGLNHASTRINWLWNRI